MEKSFNEKMEQLKDRFEVVQLSKEEIDGNPHLEMSMDFKVRKIITSEGEEAISSLEGFIAGENKETKRYYLFRGDYIEVVESEFIWPAKIKNDLDQNRIFLVIDKKAIETGEGEYQPQIAFYFGLSCGLILDTPDSTRTKSEGTLVDAFLQAFSISDKDRRESLIKELEHSIKKVLGSDETARLKTIAEKEVDMYLDRKVTMETDAQSILSEETFPAIELTHFVKNINYRQPDEFTDFSLGEYVFWEIIMEKIETIKAEAGLQYLYLFAADPDMNADPIEEQQKDDLAHSDLIDEERATKISEAITGKLISYYRNHYGFRIIEGKRLIKPAYDYRCYSMYVDIASLEEMKKLYWGSLDTSFKRRKHKKGHM